MKNVPKLRFKGFIKEWEKINFTKCVSIKTGQVSPLEEPYCDMPHIGPGNMEKFTGKLLGFNTAKEDNQISGKFLFDEEDIIYGKINPQLGKVVFPRFVGLCSADSYPLKANKNRLNNYFLYLYLQTERFLKYSVSVSMRSGMPKINRDELSEFNFMLPLLQEQQKIADFLAKVDRIIEKQDEKVENLEKYKKGMMQKIFSQEVRFKNGDGGEYSEWGKSCFNKILIEDLHPTPKPKDKYEKLSVRSHAKGTFSSIVDKPEEVNMDTLYEVKENQLIVNITFAWEHAIAIVKKEDEGKLVSHRFPTYKFKKCANYKFFGEFIRMPIVKYKLGLASPGGAGRNRVLNKKEFLNIEVPLPCLEEQKKISNFLSNIDTIIEKEKQKLEALREWKKGLLQQMFV